jgi:hypothetical protein
MISSDVALARLVNDLLIGFFTTSDVQVNCHANFLGVGPDLANFCRSFSFGAGMAISGASASYSGLLARGSTTANGNWQRFGHAESDRFGTGVELGVFSGQQQTGENLSHVQCPPVSTPDAARTSTTSMIRQRPA